MKLISDTEGDPEGNQGVEREGEEETGEFRANSEITDEEEDTERVRAARGAISSAEPLDTSQTSTPPVEEETGEEAGEITREEISDFLDFMWTYKPRGLKNRFLWALANFNGEVTINLPPIMTRTGVQTVELTVATQDPLLDMYSQYFRELKIKIGDAIYFVRRKTATQTTDSTPDLHLYPTKKGSVVFPLQKGSLLVYRNILTGKVDRSISPANLELDPSRGLSSAEKPEDEE